jgi:hypothetical protein
VTIEEATAKIRRMRLWLARSYRDMPLGERVQTGLLIVTVLLVGLAFLQFRVSREALIADQRAWVMLDTMVEGPSPKQTETHVDVTYKNFGQGPALGVKIVQWVGIGEPSQPPKEWEDTASPLTLGPGQQTFRALSLTKTFTRDATPFIAGRILYRDQFGKHRRTLFCAQKVFDEESGTYWLRRCRQYDDAE